MKLPRGRRAHSPRCAAPRRSGPPGACSGRPALAVLLVAVFAALSFGPAARRAGGARTRPSSTTPRADRTPSPIRCSRRSRAGTPSGTCAIADSGYGGQRAAGGLLPALPAAGARRWRRSAAARRPRCWRRRYSIALAAFLGALALLYRLVSLELGRPLARPALLLLCRLPGGRVLRRALLGEPVPGAGGGRVLRRADRPLGVGGRLRGARRPPRAAPAFCCCCRWLIALVGVARSAARATSPGSCSPRSGWSPTRLYLGLAEGDALALPRRPGRLVARARRSRSRRLGRARRGCRRRAPAARRARASPSTSSTAAGDPFRIAAINLMLFGSLVFAVVACVGRVPAAAPRLRRLGGRVAGAAAERCR